ncbi:MAG: hypothetical protein GY947_23300 [Rhodobacteraceae bacterium]|nr:hypothetical protein [Paracoccaceae bacterium]
MSTVALTLLGTLLLSSVAMAASVRIEDAAVARTHVDRVFSENNYRMSFAEFDPERRALFISVLEENNCRMNNFQPVDGILKGIEANGFTRDEVRAIAKDILATGDGVRQGEFMVLKTGSCA